MSTDHSVHLAESLQKLELQQEASSPSLAQREGYGSGAASPITGTEPAKEVFSLPDPHGLGWPGENPHWLWFITFFH
jgi:hypothetical protein